MPPPTAHDAGIDYGEIAADIAADNMAAHIAAVADQEMAAYHPASELRTRGNLGSCPHLCLTGSAAWWQLVWLTY